MGYSSVLRLFPASGYFCTVVARGFSHQRHRKLRSKLRFMNGSDEERDGVESLKKAIDQLPSPDKDIGTPTYASLLRRCIEEKALQCGRRLHLHIMSSRFIGDIYIQNLLVQMYAECGCIELASMTFDRMSKRNLFSWNLMLGILSEGGEDEKVMETYKYMWHQTGQHNSVTFTFVLRACGNLKDMSYGRFIHNEIISAGLHQNRVVQIPLINMYGKCGGVHEARMVFDDIVDDEEENENDPTAWNAMITAYAQNGHVEEAIQLYKKMEFEGVEPDAETFSSVLSACRYPQALEQGKALHARACDVGVDKEHTVQNAFIDMYARCHSLIDARNVFEEMVKKDVIAWNSMITAFAQAGKTSHAYDLIKEMETSGVPPNKGTYLNFIRSCTALPDARRIHARIVARKIPAVESALIEMYSACGSIYDATCVFEKMKRRDVDAWNAILAAYDKHRDFPGIIQLYHKMPLTIVHSEDINYATVIAACTQVHDEQTGKEIYSLLSQRKHGFDAAIKAALAEMNLRLEDTRRLEAV